MGAKVTADGISSIIKERVDNFELNLEDTEMNKTLTGPDITVCLPDPVIMAKEAVGRAARVAKIGAVGHVAMPQATLASAEKAARGLTLAGLDIMSGGVLSRMLYTEMGKQKASQSQETQLRKIALAQQKRERKAHKKLLQGLSNVK